MTANIIAKIVTNERERTSLLDSLSQRVKYIFAIYGKDSKKYKKIILIYYKCKRKKDACLVNYN